MDVVRGQLVRVTAGKEKGRVMAALDAADGSVLLCDGKKRPIDRPKSKNIRHVEPMYMVLEERYLSTNRELKRAIARFADK